MSNDPLGDHNGVQDYVGFRFTNVTIPQGAIIDSATLTVVSYDTRSGSTQVMLRGEANGNPPTFSMANSPRVRAPTTAGVTWPINQGWTANQAYTSPDIAALIQEIVNRPDWASGNALVLLVWDVVVDNQKRLAATYERSPSQAAELRLTFHLTGPTSGNALVLLLADDGSAISVSRLIYAYDSIPVNGAGLKIECTAGP